MNERITLKKDYVIIDEGDCGEYVKVHTSHWNSVPKIVIHAGGDVVLDAGRLDALLDVLHCWKDTGSFAALADTSNVPWIGKRMRRDGRECKVIQLPALGSEWCKIEDPCGSVHAVSFDSLLPLAPPAPKVRPFSELGSGEFFCIPSDSKKRTFQKHVTKPLGNECATDEDYVVYLFKDETPCEKIESIGKDDPNLVGGD